MGAPWSAAVEREARDLLTPPPLPDTVFARTADDPGLFEPDDVIWQLHAERSGVVGGLRALLLQTLHPVAMAAVSEHSAYRTDPWGRLHRTATFLAVTTYGTTSAAEATIARIRRVHDTVTGIAPNGLPYRANDPDLLAWVHATEVDSFLAAARRYGEHHYDRAAGDRYVADMATVGAALGVIDPPRTEDDLAAYLRDIRPDLHATPEAREAVRFLLNPPMPARLRPAYAVVTAASVGLLPGWARRSLLLPASPLADALVVRPVTVQVLDAMRRMLGPSPAVTAAAAATAHAGTVA
ncbi:MAG: DUF2236 domain-containing protein [Actinobacteria bacterium]|nr:DUF2236 domain-containing protein [Actinomycetota bacterium]